MVIRLLVCGGRDFTDAALLDRTLDAIHRKHAIEALIEGECPTKVNADKLARLWAESRGVPVEAVPVDHALDGPWPRAGPRRNERMHWERRPTHCVAFPTPKSKGTWDMVERFNACPSCVAPAWVVGVPVREIVE